MSLGGRQNDGERSLNGSLLVIALGGNALLPKGKTLDADAQKSNVKKAAALIAQIADTRPVIVTHGNGPQVGLLAQQAAAYKPGPLYPLDVLGAESEGMIGYMLDQQLTNLVDAEVVTLITQVVVDPGDPAFQNPGKPIGPTYDEADADRLAAHFGWAMARNGAGFRRVVPSPVPLRIIEIRTIRFLIRSGAPVICAGGGGVPVVIAESGMINGIEAVIDKDRTAALLAVEIGADELLILTDVDAVYTDWGTPLSRPVRQAAPDQLAEYTFEEGTMGPKLAAACEFAAQGGTARIGALEDALMVLKGEAGTTIRGGVDILQWRDS